MLGMENNAVASSALERLPPVSRIDFASNLIHLVGRSGNCRLQKARSDNIHLLLVETDLYEPGTTNRMAPFFLTTTI